MNNLPIMFEYTPGYWFNLCDISYIEPRLYEENTFCYTLKDGTKVKIPKEKHETIIKVLQSHNYIETNAICELVATKILNYQRKYLDIYLNK